MIEKLRNYSQLLYTDAFGVYWNLCWEDTCILFTSYKRVMGALAYTILTMCVIKHRRVFSSLAIGL